MISSKTNALLTHTLASFWRKQSCYIATKFEAIVICDKINAVFVSIKARFAWCVCMYMYAHAHMSGFIPVYEQMNIDSLCLVYWCILKKPRNCVIWLNHNDMLCTDNEILNTCVLYRDYPYVNTPKVLIRYFLFLSFNLSTLILVDSQSMHMMCSSHCKRI